MMEHFAEIVNNSQLLTIFVESYILDVCLGSKYTSGCFPRFFVELSGTLILVNLEFDT